MIEDVDEMLRVFGVHCQLGYLRSAVQSFLDGRVDRDYLRAALARVDAAATRQD